MLDLYSRQVVGWQMSARIDRHLVCDALQAALVTRGLSKEQVNGLMVHSDQGIQYASKDYCKLIAHYHLTQSMSRRGNCWDNAVAESFFATLKKQAVHGERLALGKLRSSMFLRILNVTITVCADIQRTVG